MIHEVYERAGASTKIGANLLGSCAASTAVSAISISEPAEKTSSQCGSASPAFARAGSSRRRLRRLLVSLDHRDAAVKKVSRWRMGAQRLLGATSPFLSTAPHPPVLSARTVAGAARRARMRK